LNLSNSNGTGPFGTILLHELGDGKTVRITETLQPGEVFADASGKTLEFNINEDFSYVPGTLPLNFTTGTNDTANPYGTFSSWVSCRPVCGSGTSSPTYSGPLQFEITNAMGLTISNFVKSSVKSGDGFYFASDIGTPNGQGGFNTFLVSTSATTTQQAPPPSTPEPGSFVLLAGGLGVGMWFRRSSKRRKQTELS
jgi:hypothetical protein